MPEPNAVDLIANDSAPNACFSPQATTTESQVVCSDNPLDFTAPEVVEKSYTCHLTFLNVTVDGFALEARFDNCNRDGVPADAPAHLKSPLSSYDLVIEAVADPDDKVFSADELAKIPPPTKKQVSIQGSCGYEGACEAPHHPVMIVSPTSGSNWKLSTAVNSTSVGPIQAGARGGYHGSVGGFFDRYWPFGRGIQNIEVRADSCGAPSGQGYLGVLRALVAVYPDETYELAIKIPAFKQWKGSQEASVDLKGKKETSQSTSKSTWGKTDESYKKSTEKSVQDGTDLTSESLTIRDGKVTTTLSESSGTKGFADHLSQSESEQHATSKLGGLVEKKTTYTHSDSTEEDEKLFSDRSTEVTQSISLKKNGVELPVTKALNDILNIAKRVQTAIEAVKNFVPKVGFSITASVSVLEGTITGKWGRELSSKSGMRYRAVREYYSIEFDVTIFSLSLEAMLGFELIVESFFSSKKVVELILKGAFKNTIKATAKVTFTSSETPAPYEAEASNELEFQAIAKAYTDFVYPVHYEASTTLKGGFDVKATLTVSRDKAPDALIRLRQKATEVEVKLIGPEKKVKVEKFQIWKEEELGSWRPLANAEAQKR
ncbi:MAG: hypothetical protein KDC38_19350 [Planctomycetes bacterium]|nr:hypothetical protein [Planctomycetota bacterium]